MSRNAACRLVPCSLAPYLLGLTLAAQDSAPEPAKPALRGLDPVALCKGEETAGRDDLALTYGRFRYRFADAATRATFQEDPARWGIQWDGGCARMGPLSGTGSPDRWVVHDGRIYIFASDGCRAGFQKQPERYAPKAAADPAPPETKRLAAGRAWIEKAVGVHGGAAAIDAVKALRLTRTGTQGGWHSTLQLLVEPRGGVRRHSTWTPPADDTTSRPLDAAWVLCDRPFTVSNGEVFDILSRAGCDDLRRLALREPVVLLGARDTAGFRAVHRGRTGSGDASLVEVEVDCHGLKTQLFLDPDSGAIRRFAWRGRATGGATAAVTESVLRWRRVRGVDVVDAREVAVDGEADAGLSRGWTKVEVLDEVPAGAFTRPR